MIGVIVERLCIYSSLPRATARIHGIAAWGQRSLARTFHSWLRLSIRIYRGVEVASIGVLASKADLVLTRGAYLHILERPLTKQQPQMWAGMKAKLLISRLTCMRMRACKLTA